MIIHMFRSFRYITACALLIALCQCKGKPAMPAGDKDNGGLALPDGFEAVVVVDSIPSAPSDVFVVAYPHSLSDWEVAQQYLITWAMFVFSATIALGNSTWHNPKFVFLSLAICVAGLLMVGLVS